MRVIYVMGLWRSGSTLLDVVLGNHGSIESVGELRNLPGLGWMERGTCGCGETAGDCEYWQSVREHWTRRVGRGRVPSLIQLQDRFERLRSLPWLLRQSARPSPAFREYGTMVGALYDAIGEVSGRPIVVDSTKYPARAYALSLTRRVNLYLVHLVRDGRAVIWSCMRKPNTMPDGRVPETDAGALARRTTLQWLQVNLACDALLRAPSTVGVRVRYEDLVANPADALVPIGSMLGIDMRDLATDLRSGQEMRIGHLIAGNRIRMRGALRLSPDMEWATRLPVGHRRLFWACAGWLARRYGYSRA
ncbi:MAG: sulfotransferase [Gemmatimonadota bacterium]